MVAQGYQHEDADSLFNLMDVGNDGVLSKEDLARGFGLTLVDVRYTVVVRSVATWRRARPRGKARWRSMVGGRSGRTGCGTLSLP